MERPERLIHAGVRPVGNLDAGAVVDGAVRARDQCHVTHPCAALVSGAGSTRYELRPCES